MPDSSHYVAERNRFGWHDREFFIPDDNIPVRCPECSNLMSAEYFDEHCCPNCKFKWAGKRRIAVDIYCEAKLVKLNFGGWTHEVLDILGCESVPMVISKDGDCKPIDDVAREAVAAAIAMERKMVEEELERRSSAEEKLLYHLRSQSLISQI